MRKRLLSLALALVLCLGLTVPAAAATMTEIISPDTYQEAGNSLESFSEGVARVGQLGYGGYGAVDTDGNTIIPPKTYGDVTAFSEGIAWAYRDSAWRAVDITGKEIFTLDEGLTVNAYGNSDFHEGLAKVINRETGKYGFVDKTGKVVIPIEHSKYGSGGEPFHDGLALVYDSANAYYGYIDKTGKMVLPYQYTEAASFKNGFGFVVLGNRWTIIDTTGRELIPQSYLLISDYTTEERISSEVFTVSGPNGWGFVNRAGQIVSEGYEHADPFSDGMARVSKDGKIGYVNEAGVLVIPCQYDSDGNYDQEFIDGYAKVKVGDGYRIIDKTGKVTGSPNYGRNNWGPAGSGYFWFSSSESGRTRFGFIDCTGREIVSPKYKSVEDFSGGVAAVENFEGKWGFVDTTGAEIVPCKLDSVYYINEPGIFVVENYNGDGRKSVIKSSGWTAPSAPSAPSTPAKPAGPSANPTNSKVLVNGKEVAFDAYTIDGSNYFKLRDLAYVLNGTEKQFEVGWDNASKTITLTSGQGYTANGSEMAKGGGAQSASVSASKLIIDGKEVSLTAYSIGGNNYFKLRDIGQAFDFGIGWDNASKTITIDTSASYTA